MRDLLVSAVTFAKPFHRPLLFTRTPLRLGVEVFGRVRFQSIAMARNTTPVVMPVNHVTNGKELAARGATSTE